MSETFDDARLAELRAMSYVEYLQTPEWLRTRAAALERAGERCAAEPVHTKRLDAYHRSTERLGAEHDDDLVVLCRSCHVIWHRAYGLPRWDDPAVTGEPAPPPAPAQKPPRRSKLHGLARLLPR